MNGASGVAGLAVNQPRQQLLAGAAFAENQHRGRQLGDLVHQIDDVAGHLARPDDELALGLVGDLRGQRQDLPVRDPGARSALRTSDRSWS